MSNTETQAPHDSRHASAQERVQELEQHISDRLLLQEERFMTGNAKKVVLVDDDPDILDAFQAMLEDEGYIVVTTDRGEEVEAISLSERPDLIILDMLLSGKDGREIARQLKGLEGTKDIPILMLSAHPRAAQEAQIFEVNDFLAKPFEMDELLAKVAQYC